MNAGISAYIYDPWSGSKCMHLFQNRDEGKFNIFYHIIIQLYMTFSQGAYLMWHCERAAIVAGRHWARCSLVVTYSNVRGQSAKFAVATMAPPVLRWVHHSGGLSIGVCTFFLSANVSCLDWHGLKNFKIIASILAIYYWSGKYFLCAQDIYIFYVST